ncbi:MAG: hypothetical protein KAJ23_09785 [Maribacter sp.]|nr:hypothetical protein [Maribacter sp.]
MRSYLHLIPALFFVVLWGSCRKNFEYAPSTGNLEFSKDTVFLDTIFTNIGSSTYSLKVYNRNRDDLEIPSIRLEQGQNSRYRLNVDGVAGKEFLNVPIFAQDSLFIRIETTYDISNSSESEFLYTDVLQFDSGNNQQNVHLVTLIKDAIFLYPSTLVDGTKETLALGVDIDGNEIKAEGFYLADNQLNFSNEKPYVVYGYAAVASGKGLNIEAGARVHFHKNSGIYVANGAYLTINGELSLDPEMMENEVVFEGDRLEPEYSDIPGQWGVVWLAEGSVDNLINHLTLKNATTGLLVEGDGMLQSPTLTIKNTQVHNSSQNNLWAKNAAIIGENLVLGSAGNSSLYCSLGGDYSFTHCTIANYWSHGFRMGTALQINNQVTSPSGVHRIGDLVQARFLNCIVDGSANIELSLRNNGTNSFNYIFEDSLIKFEDDNIDPLYDFSNTLIFDQIHLNKDTHFINVIRHDFRISEASSANEKANLENSLLVPFDILGTDRTVLPDIGAYQN